MFSASALTSICEKLRECAPDFDFTSDFCIRGLYRGYKGSVRNPEAGFLQSSLLVKVTMWLHFVVSLSYLLL